MNTNTPDNAVMIKFKIMINSLRPPSPMKQLTTIAIDITTVKTHTTETFRINAPNKPINSNVKQTNAIISIATAPSSEIDFKLYY